MYIKHQFMKYVQGLSSDQKILIIYDGHKYSVGSLASKAYVQALSAENLKSAFRKTGIYPLDAKVIDPQVLMPSTINCNKENVQQFPLKNTLLWTLIKEMKIILWLTQMIIINFAK
ncbi:hypothetical protein KUTeg_018739 [Tegillarca granosa]|uniref:Uncharacterized protein n=1 Tax=Tegillarca granosa TaxID=220873 RepID=A0ABQ9EIF0_TEGGR|nr:hypothetical protein KUTeg_018739 [Tegillarca granosa]